MEIEPEITLERVQDVLHSAMIPPAGFDPCDAMEFRYAAESETVPECMAEISPPDLVTPVTLPVASEPVIVEFLVYAMRPPEVLPSISPAKVTAVKLESIAFPAIPPAEEPTAVISPSNFDAKIEKSLASPVIPPTFGFRSGSTLMVAPLTITA